MAWFTRFTRFGDAHLVYAQEKENSCGIACVMMTVFKINKLKLGKKAVHTEKHIYDVYSTASGTTYDGTSYSFASHLAATLNRLDVGKWKAEYVGKHAVAKALVDHVGTAIVGLGPIINAARGGSPMIVLVGWDAGDAHFVVVDVVNNFGGKLYASVCDPWDGNVHVTPFQVGQPFHYTGARVPLSWDLGGTRHSYPAKNPGASNGWVIRPA